MGVCRDIAVHEDEVEAFLVVSNIGNVIAVREDEVEALLVISNIGGRRLAAR